MHIATAIKKMDSFEGGVFWVLYVRVFVFTCICACVLMCVYMCLHVCAREA